MVRRIHIFLVAFAACVGTNLAAAYAPPNYEFTSQMEDACFHAKESGLPLPWLFGVEVRHRTFVVSLFAGPGQQNLGSIPFQQLDPSVLH
jgi:hypothetical protein